MITDTLNRRSAGVYVIDSLANVIHRNIFYKTDYSIFFSISNFLNNDFIFSGTVNTNQVQERDIYVVRADSTLFAKPVSIREHNHIVVKKYKLHQNFPNPFNSSTIIKYNIPYSQIHNYYLKVFDILGKEISTFDITSNAPGQIIFNSGNICSGIYYYSLLEDNTILQTEKMVYIQ